MAAFSHNGEPGSALDAELKGHDTRHREGYAAGFKAGREAGMREAAAKLKERDERAYKNIKDFAEQEKVSMSENEYLLGLGDEAHGAYMAILSAIGEK